MIKGTTKTGFDYEVSDERANNYELLELFDELEDNPAIMPRVVKLLLGNDQASKLKDHVRNEEGLVPAEQMGEEIKDILEGQDDVKKSESSPK